MCILHVYFRCITCVYHRCVLQMYCRYVTCVFHVRLHTYIICVGCMRHIYSMSHVCISLRVCLRVFIRCYTRATYHLKSAHVLCWWAVMIMLRLFGVTAGML